MFNNRNENNMTVRDYCEHKAWQNKVVIYSSTEDIKPKIHINKLSNESFKGSFCLKGSIALQKILCPFPTHDFSLVIRISYFKIKAGTEKTSDKWHDDVITKDLKQMVTTTVNPFTSCEKKA